ncbi:hypothetical protein Cgig2_003809 [Carnegiea gigantea]|uniref:beta-glucosidase n=1 Tax=Carnegiea gigantea TaxID=171969 RepID=A0A9Q1K5G3_9CARY|nr:hypothetical protein Cgig2_003809 [Carnegiea gigantea]
MRLRCDYYVLETLATSLKLALKWKWARHRDANKVFPFAVYEHNMKSNISINIKTLRHNIPYLQNFHPIPSVLKGPLVLPDGFLVKITMGFVLSYWEGIDRITSPPHANYTYSVLAGVQAGIDMVMAPNNYQEFINDLKSLVTSSNVIPMMGINDAVRRILRMKFIIGLFENPMADLSLVNQIGSQSHNKSNMVCKSFAKLYPFFD